jgi:hypothetical protein
VPVSLVGEMWRDPGAVGVVGAITGSVPATELADVFVYEVHVRDGEVRLVLWTDFAPLAQRMGESTPDVEFRVDSSWSALGTPVEVPRPESVAD